MKIDKLKEKVICAMDDKVCPPSAVPGQSLPWFIYTHSDAKSKKVQTFSTAPFNNKSYLRSVPEMRGKFIQAALLGWLLLRDEKFEDRDNYSFTLWNPFTSKSIHLPPLIFNDEGPGRMRCALTSSPCDNEHEDDGCFLFLFFQGWAFSCQIHPKRRENIGWVSRRIEVEGETAAISRVVTLNKVLYGLAHTTINRISIKCMVCIEVAEDGSNSFTLLSLPISRPQSLFPLFLNQSSTYMVESCGRIYIVQEGTRHYDGVHVVKVFELDLQEGKWEEVKYLGDRAFLVAEDGCTWCWATISMASDTTATVNKNSIYFYNRDYVEGGVVCYRLDDYSSTFLPCPKLLNPRSRWPVWVTPQHTRFSGRRQCEKERIEKKDEVVNTPKCLSLSQHDKMQENNLDSLPLHMIDVISTYMHLFDYWNFRSTSKMIHSATSIPQWRSNNFLPLLMVFEDGGLCRLMDPYRDDSHHCILPFSQDFFDVKFSKNGWLLIRDKKSLQFLNPFTRERVILPPLRRHYLTIGFSSYPTCSGCLTVTINTSKDGIVINYLRFGDTEWKSCRFVNNNQDSPFYPGFCSPMYYSGGFYFLDEITGSLGVFELLEGEDARWTVYNRPFVRAGGFHSSYLVECNGELISVFIGKNGSWIQVFKFNNLKKSWVRVKDLGNHILFISHVSCYSEVTEENNTRNRIYLPWLKGKRIVYYSLTTGKYHVDGSEDSFKDFFFMEQPSKCCWI